MGVPGYSCYQGSETLRTGLAEGRCSHSSWSDTDQTLFELFSRFFRDYEDIKFPFVRLRLKGSQSGWGRGLVLIDERDSGAKSNIVQASEIRL